MKSRWALCVLGGWAMGSVIMFVVATKNFWVVDELLRGSENPKFHSLVELWGAAPMREVLRYLSSELNREYFQLWNFVQIGLAALVLWLVARQPGYERTRGVMGATLAIVVAIALLGGSIATVGRSLDFVPRDPAPPALGRFWIMHIAYLVMDLGKLLVLGTATVWLVRRAEPGGAAAKA
jgi:hypothetical protein